MSHVLEKILRRTNVFQNFKMAAQYHMWELPGEDIWGAFNARAHVDHGPDVDAALRQYLTVDESGVPVARSAFPPQLTNDPEENWEVIDYVDIPTSRDI